MARSTGFAFPLATLKIGACLLLGLTACTEKPQYETPYTEDCPAWASDPEDSHSNGPAPTLGCVNRLNLMNMVDRPSDLVKGRDMGPSNGERESLGIANYEQGKIKPFGPINPPGELALPTGTMGGQ